MKQDYINHQIFNLSDDILNFINNNYSKNNIKHTKKIYKVYTILEKFKLNPTILKLNCDNFIFNNINNIKKHLFELCVDNIIYNFTHSKNDISLIDLYMNNNEVGLYPTIKTDSDVQKYLQFRYDICTHYTKELSNFLSLENKNYNNLNNYNKIIINKVCNDFLKKMKRKSEAFIDGYR